MSVYEAEAEATVSDAYDIAVEKKIKQCAKFTKLTVLTQYCKQKPCLGIPVYVNILHVICRLQIRPVIHNGA